MNSVQTYMVFYGNQAGHGVFEVSNMEKAKALAECLSEAKGVLHVSIGECWGRLDNGLPNINLASVRQFADGAWVVPYVLPRKARSS